MRQILTFKLYDGTKLVFIGDFNDKYSAQSTVINYSARLFGQKKFILNNKTVLLDYERWSQKNQSGGNNSGNKTFSAAVVYNGNSVINKVQAGGVKTAYNQLKKMYNIPCEPVVFLYDTSQEAKLGNIVYKSQSILYDKNKLNKLIDDFAEKAMQNKLLGPIAADLTLFGAMVNDVVTGAYKKIPIYTLVMIIGIIVYFVSPVNLAFEAIPVIGQVDDMILINLIYNEIHKDIAEYQKWRNETALLK